MSLTVFFCVIMAAVLHACWNALAKSGDDKHLNMAAVVLGHIPFAIAVLPFVPLPAAESLPYLVAGIALHFGYQLLLMTSYRIGDLTQVYPIARGTAPLLVAGISTIFLGVELNATEMLAILTIGAGILSLSLVQQRGGGRNLKASGFALATGCFIAAYSLVDGLGARVAGTALGFYGWMTLANALLFALWIGLTKPHLLREIPRRAKRTFFFGGSASAIAYALVIWSFTQAPIALVTALRETSIVFALVIGVVFLKERLDLGKVVATFLTLIGAALLRFSKT